MLTFDNQLKPNSHVLLAISIGQAQQTGAHFLEMVDLIIATPAIKTVTLLKADSLQRFRLQAAQGLSEEEALAVSISAGAEWQQSNAEAVAKLEGMKGKVEIKTWNHYRLLPNFPEKLKQIEELYSAGQKFRHQVDSVMGNFCKKLSKDLGEKYNHSFISTLMRQYIIEESAVLILFSEDSAQYEYELYRGQRNHAMNLALHKFGQPDRVKATAFLEGDQKNTLSSFSLNGHVMPDNAQQIDFHVFLNVADETENLEAVKQRLHIITMQLSSVQLFLAQKNAGDFALKICQMFIEIIQLQKYLDAEMRKRSVTQPTITEDSDLPSHPTQGNSHDSTNDQLYIS